MALLAGWPADVVSAIADAYPPGCTQLDPLTARVALKAPAKTALSKRRWPRMMAQSVGVDAPDDVLALLPKPAKRRGRIVWLDGREANKKDERPYAYAAEDALCAIGGHRAFSREGAVTATPRKPMFVRRTVKVASSASKAKRRRARGGPKRGRSRRPSSAPRARSASPSADRRTTLSLTRRPSSAPRGRVGVRGAAPDPTAAAEPRVDVEPPTKQSRRTIRGRPSSAGAGMGRPSSASPRRSIAARESTRARPSSASPRRGTEKAKKLSAMVQMSAPGGALEQALAADRKAKAAPRSRQASRKAAGAAQ